MGMTTGWLRSRWAEPAGIALVAALVVSGSIAEAYPGHHYAGLDLRSHPLPVAFALLALPALALWWRRSRPVTVYVLAVAAVTAWAASGQVYGAALVMVLVAFYSLTITRSGWIVPVTLGVAGTLCIWLAGGLGGPWGWMGGPQLDMWPEMVAAGSLGAFVAARRHWKDSEELRRQQLHEARREEIRQRVTSERLRIARELHDVVAHSMAMINVQASAAATLIEADPRRALESIEAIRGASRHGLRELRSILDVLRQVDEESPAVALPDRHGLQALVDAARAAGVDTTLECDAGLDQASATTALAVYRIVQESLTNVIRHTHGARAEVRVTSRDGHTVVDVTNEGGNSKEPFVEGSGTGIVGMTERARAIGGNLQAGPVDGGFQVHAELPATTEVPDGDDTAFRARTGS